MSKKEIKTNNDEKEERLKEERNRAIRKRLFRGCLVIIACFAMILGIMYGATSAEEKIRMILLITFCSLLGASLLSFILYVLIRNYIDVKNSDPEYVAKKQARLKAKREKKSRKKTK